MPARLLTAINNPFLFRLNLERSSKQECLLSVERTDLQSQSIELRYQESSKKNKLTVIKDVQSILLSNATYLKFTATGYLRTGYIYDFIMEAKSNDGESVKYICKDHLMRGSSTP